VEHQANRPMLRATAAPFVPADAHMVFTIQLSTSCGASVAASDYSVPSSPRSSVAGSLADDRDLETHLAPRVQVCPQLRKIGKKLAQVEQLKAKQAAGGELHKNQLAKIAQEAELRAQKSILERDLAGKRALQVLSRRTAPAVATKTRTASRQHGGRSDTRPSSTQPPARSATGRRKPPTRVSLQMYVDRADAASQQADALSQLDQKVEAVRAAQDKRQGWIRVPARK
jgi:hypothetical protein